MADPKTLKEVIDGGATKITDFTQANKAVYSPDVDTQADEYFLLKEFIQDNYFTLINESDATKKLKFLLSSISASTTRTLTIPDISGLLAVYGMANAFRFGSQAHGGYYVKTFSATGTFNANDGNNQVMTCTGDTTINISNEISGVFIFDLPISGGGVSSITLGASLGTAYDNTPALVLTDGSVNTITVYVNPSGSKRYTINTITA